MWLLSILANKIHISRALGSTVAQKWQWNTGSGEGHLHFSHFSRFHIAATETQDEVRDFFVGCSL